MKIDLVITGRGYDQAAGLPRELELADHATLDDALAKTRQLLEKENSPVAAGGTAPSALPESCLVILSGEHLGSLADHQSRPLRDGDELLLMAPVAGG